MSVPIARQAHKSFGADDKITMEQLERWLGEDEVNDSFQLREVILELVNGEWEPTKARQDIREYEPFDE